MSALSEHPRGRSARQPAPASALGLRDGGISPGTKDRVDHTLALNGVSRSWRTRAGGKPVLIDLDLTVQPGSVTWIGGKNGTGKTTLLRVVCGMLSPDTGSVSFRGLDPDRDRREYHRQLGLLAAGDRGLYARLSVVRHLEFWARLAYVPRHERRDCIDRAREAFELGDLIDRRVDRLSLGQRQRVRLAMAAMHEPNLLLLDEPASSLDEDGLRVVRTTVGAVADRGGIVLWCSPPTERTVIGSDRELELCNGRLVEL